MRDISKRIKLVFVNIVDKIVAYFKSYTLVNAIIWARFARWLQKCDIIILNIITEFFLWYDKIYVSYNTSYHLPPSAIENALICLIVCTCILTFRYNWYTSYTSMEVTAMISDDPVEVTAIRIMITTRISPVLPINLCATIGGTKPATNIIIHSPKNMYHTLLHCFHAALLNTLLSRKRLQENVHVHYLTAINHC